MKKKYLILAFPCPECNEIIRVHIWSRDLRQVIQGKKEVVEVRPLKIV